MTSVLTGDIIKSRKAEPNTWLEPLKKAISNVAIDEAHWEIYRGDSFQIEVNNLYESFMAAVYIKACIRSIKGLDVRIAIGVGEKSYIGETITESNGEVFEFSGDTMETLKKEKQNLRIKTRNSIINNDLNTCFKLALIAMDNWTANSAEIVKLSIEYPNKLQSELGDIININQNAVSTRQKRAHWDAIKDLDLMYRRKLKQL